MVEPDAGFSLYNSGRQLLLENEGPPLPAHVQAGLAVGVVVVVAIAGIMSGLTLGLLSMDRLDMELMLRTGSKKQERYARRLQPIVSQPHWVLATLVICNTAAGMALPLCLDRLVNVAVALVLSTTAIVLFGEILPQAVCSRYGLSIGGHAAPVVRLLMWLTAPISWPIAKCLDWLLGHEQTVFGKRQISALVDLHRESAGMGGPLNEEEAHVIQGVLDLSSKTGNKAMTPLGKVFMVSTNEVLDRPTLKRILDSGHSRVPVYRAPNRADIIGLILVKELLAVVGLSEPGSGPVRVKDLRIRDLPALPLETPMTDLLNLFQTGHSHMALLLQKQDGKGSKDAASAQAAAGGVSTITAVASCSSSSEAGSTPTHTPGPGSSPQQHGDSTTTKRNPVAKLLRVVSGKSFKRSPSIKQGATTRDSAAAAAHDAHTTLVVLPTSSDTTASGGVEVLEPGSIAAQQQLVLVAASPATPSIPVATAVGGGGGPASSNNPDRPLTAPAALSSSAGGAGGLNRPSGGALARPSAASVWREAGWDAAGGVPVGIITLEDVLEELMQEEIIDETDAFIDNEQQIKVNARVLAMSLPPGLRRLLVTSQQLQAQRLVNHQQQQVAAAAAAAAALPPPALPLAAYGSSPALTGGSGGSLAHAAASSAGGAGVGGVGGGSSSSHHGPSNLRNSHSEVVTVAARSSASGGAAVERNSARTVTHT